MKKGLLLIALVVVLVGGYFAIFSKKKSGTNDTVTTKDEKQSRLSISKNPQQFNDTFSNMLHSYFSVKDDLVNWDSTKAGNDAVALAQLASALPVNILKGDSNLVITAKNFAGAIATQSKAVTEAKTIQDKRRAFSVVSDNLYSLINTVRYDKERMFYDMCPMAFNESEQGYWLSKDSAIQNPYLGNKHPKYKGAMVTCGSVEQTIDYANAKK
ncbi:MAG: DUF3347 domain-containing protein [Bacteroidota bacterium]|nr:DUF3347 domain-containing protein [Bacteroidota bacterium]